MENIDIEKLKKQLADVIFMRGLLTDFDLEAKVNMNAEIEKIQSTIDKYNLQLEEIKRSQENILDDMFLQASKSLPTRYTSNIEPTGNDFAPDGTPSLLSPELNRIVRSKQFLDWFGDWVSAYKFRPLDEEFNVSKVLADNGEPLLVWHGTGKEFNFFKMNIFPATYFAQNKEYCEFFARLQSRNGEGYVLPFFLNIKKPLDLTNFGIENVKGSVFWNDIFLKTGLNEQQLSVNPLFLDKNAPALPVWVYIRNNAKMLQALKDSNLFDGIIFYETNPNVDENRGNEYQTKAYIIFDPHQAKLADPNRGDILFAAFRSFKLKQGGLI